MGEVNTGYRFEIVFDEVFAQQCGENVEDWYRAVADIVTRWGVQETSRGVWSPIRGVRDDDLFTQVHALTSLAESRWFMERVQSVTFFEEEGKPHNLMDEIRSYRPDLIPSK